MAYVCIPVISFDLRCESVTCMYVRMSLYVSGCILENQPYGHKC